MAIHPSRQAYVEEDAEDGIDLANLQATAGTATGETSSILTEFARKREAARIAVPTDDTRVMIELRARAQPIRLFAERPEDRRDRLRQLMYEAQGGDDEVHDTAMKDENDEEENEDEVEFFTKGTPELLIARRKIAHYSIPRAKRRIDYQRKESAIPVTAHVNHRKQIKDKLRGFELFGSQIAGERPVGIVRFAPNGQLAACGDWSGSLKLLDLPNLDTKQVWRGHTQLVGGISWYPGATLPTSDVTPSAINLASSGGEGDIHLWSLEKDTPVATLSGHSARVCRTEFHPSGQFIASASFDMTWRLWDVATTTELLLQEGHAKEVFAVSFNEDGSLLASAGLDSIGRVWDLRTGRVAMILEGHVAPIHALDWSPDGYRVLSGSSDGFAKCWDLRAIRECASIGAHANGVSDLRWFKGTDSPLNAPSKDIEMADPDSSNDAPDREHVLKKSGTFIVSSGFDSSVKIFSADDWALCKQLKGHDSVVLAADVTSDARWIASCGRDRTVKLWARDDGEGL